VTDRGPVIAGVAGRYALALFSLARERDELAEVEEYINHFAEMLDTTPDLQSLVLNPAFSKSEQHTAIQTILDRMGATETVRNFFGLVVRNGRLAKIGKTIKAFATFVAHHRGELGAVVTSVGPLTPEQEDALKQRLKTLTGKDVNVDLNIDPALLGGVIVQLGSKMFDGSLRTKINNLKLAMDTP
jgi:F-type H+-transporting ATPase subunit delta